MNFIALLQLESYPLSRSGHLPNERIQSVISVVSSVGPQKGPVRSETLPLAVDATGLALFMFPSSSGEQKVTAEALCRGHNSPLVTIKGRTCNHTSLMKSKRTGSFVRGLNSCDVRFSAKKKQTSEVDESVGEPRWTSLCAGERSGLRNRCLGMGVLFNNGISMSGSGQDLGTGVQGNPKGRPETSRIRTEGEA